LFRHNGNILIDNEGHVVHIDFGFMLSNSPGAIAFETAAFKFPLEYLEVLGGIKSARFVKLKELMVASFLAIRKHAEKIMLLVEMMSQGSL
jgi:phosphatidylinositol kinase/protein kinase (PI-3  family)